MSDPLFQRLQAALGGQYEIERELGSGGMGTVVLARDVTLERRVAIKILRPELATATTAERFLREARIIASLSHPNVVPVHAAGEAAGLFYYVMEYIEGETLAECLSRGPLAEREVGRLASDLLTALETAHEHGVIHRDVKPSNIFLRGDRALLADFGIAKPTDERTTTLTEPGQQVGTPAYMPPEQISGEVTSRTDLYALGMVLYEALTGRRWSIFAAPDEADWSAVPRPLARVLRRALAWSPDERWEDAASFRRAVRQVTRRRPRVPIAATAAAAVVLVAAGLLIGQWLARDGPPPPMAGVRDMAVLPVEVVGTWRGGIEGVDLGALVARRLESTPEISVVPTLVSFQWWDSVMKGPTEGAERGAASRLGARYAARATLFAQGDSVDVELVVYDALGEPVPRIAGLSFFQVRPQELSKSLARALLQVVLGEDLPDIPGITEDLDALQDYLRGERAYRRGAWLTAVRHYSSAVARDTSFVLAWWHLANAYRWLGQRGPYEKDFERLHRDHGGDLGPVDSLLMAAQLAPAGEPRFRLYQEARQRYPLEYFAAFLYGEELFNRGPLFGESLESAVEMLEQAVALNDRSTAAYVHLVWANIRLGRKEEARLALERLAQITAPPEEVGWYHPLIFGQAYRERFEPEAAAAGRPGLLSEKGLAVLERLSVFSRFAPAFDVPAVQLELGKLLVANATGLPPYRVTGHVAQGLALVSLGRLNAALAQFDSVQALVEDPEARLQAAQWRVLPGALGLPPPEAAQVETGRRALEVLSEPAAGVSGGVRDKALWTLAVDAYAVEDTERVDRLAQRLSRSSEPGSVLLRNFVRAVREATRGRYTSALELTMPILDSQACAAPLRSRASAPLGLCDPFGRSALHLLRAEWYARLGDTEKAEREWRWYTAVDVVGFPQGLPQGGEVDWALGTYARYRRGLAALARGEADAGCRHLARAAEIWSNAEPAYAEFARRAEQRAEEAC